MTPGRQHQSEVRLTRSDGSHLPVIVTQGATVVRAAGMEYDNLARVIDLKGRVHAVFAPPPRGARR